MMSLFFSSGYNSFVGDTCVTTITSCSKRNPLLFERVTVSGVE